LEVSGQLHAPAALPPGKEPPVPIGYEVGWTSAGLDDLEKRKLQVDVDVFKNFRVPASDAVKYDRNVATFRSEYSVESRVEK
jgi:hypothetical protein